MDLMTLPTLSYLIAASMLANDTIAKLMSFVLLVGAVYIARVHIWDGRRDDNVAFLATFGVMVLWGACTGLLRAIALAP